MFLNNGRENQTLYYFTEPQEGEVNVSGSRKVDFKVVPDRISQVIISVESTTAMRK